MGETVQAILWVGIMTATPFIERSDKRHMRAVMLSQTHMRAVMRPQTHMRAFMHSQMHSYCLCSVLILLIRQNNPFLIS